MANDSFEVATSTWDWPGNSACVGATHGTTVGTRLAVDRDVLGHLRGPGGVAEEGARHERPARVADQVHLIDVELGQRLVDDRRQPRDVRADVDAGTVVVVGDDAVLRVAVGHETHRL